jgi:hypothetical protein
VAQVVERLLCKHETKSSNPSPIKKNKKKKERKKKEILIQEQQDCCARFLDLGLQGVLSPSSICLSFKPGLPSSTFCDGVFCICAGPTPHVAVTHLKCG